MALFKLDSDHLLIAISILPYANNKYIESILQHHLTQFQQIKTILKLHIQIMSKQLKY
jgi:hypothetical protein